MLQHGAWVCSPHCSPAYSQAQNQKEAPFIQSLTFPQRPHQCISSPNSKAKFHLVHQKKLLPSPPFTGAGTADFLQWRFFHPGTRWVTVFLEKLLSYFPPAYKRLRFCHLRVWGAIYSEVWGQKKKKRERRASSLEYPQQDLILSQISQPLAPSKTACLFPRRLHCFRLKPFHIQATY